MPFAKLTQIGIINSAILEIYYQFAFSIAGRIDHRKDRNVRLLENTGNDVLEQIKLSGSIPILNLKKIHVFHAFQECSLEECS